MKLVSGLHYYWKQPGILGALEWFVEWESTLSLPPASLEETELYDLKTPPWLIASFSLSTSCQIVIHLSNYLTQTRLTQVRDHHLLQFPHISNGEVLLSRYCVLLDHGELFQDLGSAAEIILRAEVPWSHVCVERSVDSD